MRRHILLRPALWLLLFFLAFALAPPLGTYVGRFSPTPAAARAPVYQGYHDYVDCNYVSGWVRDLNSPGARLGVNVFDDATGALVASGMANIFRQDLLNAGIGDGRYGFMIPTPASLKSGQNFSIRVRVLNTGFSLGNTPKTFNAASAGCVIAPSYQGFHDAVTCAAVTGWVRDLNNPTARPGVSVYDDSNGGALIASGTADQYRQDLASNGFGDGYYGFSIPTPASIKNGLDHNIRVRVTGAAFSLGNTPKTFNSSTACAPPSGPITMTILNRANDPRHNNFRVQAANMSVSYTPDRYHIYGTGGYDLWKWTPDYLNWDSLYTGAWPHGGGGEDCSHATDPRVWNPRCTSDAIGYYSKRVTCPPGGGVSCQDNDRWDGWPGTYNLTTFAANDVWPNRPNEDFGTRGYTPIMNAGKVNGVQLEPASTDCWQFADTTWIDDTLPRGMIQYSDNETWKWVVASPSPTPFPASPGEPPVPAPTPVSPASPTFSPPPFQSHVSHQSADFDRMHQHYFAGDGTANTIPLKINAGDRLFAYININPASPPQEVMLQWHEPPSATLPQGSWEHRAFWGADRIEWGGANVTSPGHRQISTTVPPAGVWYRLEVEAADVGLVGKTIDGMAFTLYDGQATWDRAGKSKPAPTTKCPPKTWTTPERSVHAYNRDEYATGADSGKVVQVKYSGGQTRWFMAFNKQIKHVTTTYQIPNPNAGQPGQPATIPFNASQYGGSAADNWQILWATSPDGANWKVHPQTIIRSVTEQQREHLGPIMMEMLIDGGYFYALFQDGVKPYLYLARAPIDMVYSDTSPGYVQGGWRVAATPLTASGEYTWKSFTPGARTDFAALGAYQVMRTRLGGDFNADMKQGVIARITSPTTGASYYFGVTADLRETLQLWKTTSLTRPFQFESNVIVEDTTIDYTPFGWYANFSFNHYPDNDAATPRIFSNGFDWWMVEHKPTGRAIDGWLIVGRHTARLSDF